MDLKTLFARTLAGILGLITFLYMPILTGNAAKWYVDMNSYTYINGHKVFVASDRFELYLLVIAIWATAAACAFLLYLSYFLFLRLPPKGSRIGYALVLMITIPLSVLLSIYLAMCIFVLATSDYLVVTCITLAGVSISLIGGAGIIYAVRGRLLPGKCSSQAIKNV